jgi:hypothetical protein
MLQPLIIGGSQEDEYFQLLACESIVHNFVTVPLVAKSM